MTDTITPELAHRVLDALEQSPHIGPDGGLSALFIVRDAVRAWEAEAARDEEAERYAEVYHEAGPSASKWAALHPQSRSTLVGRMRAALDQLAADGRLLPEGAHCPNCLVDLVGVEEEDVPPAEPVPDSGPDGTPEKPWPTWQDVPEGVIYRSVADHRPISNWVNRGGQRYAVFPSGKEETSVKRDEYVQALAPFVRVDGDKA